MTVRLAILADIHADVQALENALLQARRLGCSKVVCAGDIVDYGTHAQETVEMLMAHSIPCIRGNHDRWAIARGEAGDRAVREKDNPRVAGPWNLSPSAFQFLAQLPVAWDAVIEGVRVAIRHGTPRSDMEGIYPDQVAADDARRWLRQAAADVLLVGHTHIAFVLKVLGGGLIANPGALLRGPSAVRCDGTRVDVPEMGPAVPFPVPGSGTFGALDLPSREFTVYRAADGAEVEIPRLTLGIKDRRSR